MKEPIPMRRLLPLAQAILAVGLIVLGYLQERTFHAEAQAEHPEWTLRFVYDYIPPAHAVLGLLNFVGLVISIPLLAAASLVVDRPWHLLFSLPGIWVFWYWIGAGIDRRRGLTQQRREPRFPALAVLWPWIALVGSGLLAVYLGRTLLWGSVAWLGIYVAGFLWSFGLVIHFAWRIAAGRRERAAR